MDFVVIATVASFIWAGVATIGAIMAALVRVRSGIDETTIDLWKEQAEAYKAKSERFEAELVEQKTRFEGALMELRQRVDHLEQENRTLRQLHDNRDELAAISQVLADGLRDIRQLLQEGKQ